MVKKIMQICAGCGKEMGLMEVDGELHIMNDTVRKNFKVHQLENKGKLHVNMWLTDKGDTKE